MVSPIHHVQSASITGVGVEHVPNLILIEDTDTRTSVVEAQAATIKAAAAANKYLIFIFHDSPSPFFICIT